MPGQKNGRKDGRKDGRTDGRTDRPYFIGHLRLPPRVQKNKETKKAKETKEEKRLSVENLTVYDDSVCEFALCTLTYLIEL